MVWTIEYLASVRKELKRLDRTNSRRIVDFMDGRVALLEDPRDLGKALVGKTERLWRYRVGDYRVICDMQDNRLIVLVVDIGHRSDVYR